MGTPSTVISTWALMSGRILGTPYTADGQDICQILVDSGLAVYYDGGKKTKVWA